MLQKAGALGDRVCTLCAIFFCTIIIIQNILAALSGQWLIPLIALLAAAGIGALCMRFLPAFRLFPLALFLVRFALAVFFILWLGSQPVQDFKTMYDAATQLANGSHAYLDNIYFFNWAYQSAFVSYEALIIRIFGSSLLPLQLLNALYLAGTNVLVYLIARRFLPQRAAMTAGVLYAFYPAPLFLAGVLTNQHLSVFLLYAALYLLLAGREITPLRGAAAGALMALGNAVRPIGVILLLAVLVWCILRAFYCARWRLLLSGLATGVCYFLVGALLSWLIVLSGINPQGLSNNQPMWKFVVGLNQESSGQWNQDDYETFLSLPTAEGQQTMEDAVHERLRVGPAKLAGLALRKSAAMWAGSEDLYWGFGHLTGTPACNRIQLFLGYADNGVYCAAIALALFGLLKRLRRSGRCDLSLLPAVLLCGYYAVHLIVEVQSRYRYFLMPCVFLLAGLGLSQLFPSHKKQS